MKLLPLHPRKKRTKLFSHYLFKKQEWYRVRQNDLQIWFSHCLSTNCGIWSKNTYLRSSSHTIYYYDTACVTLLQVIVTPLHQIEACNTMALDGMRGGTRMMLVWWSLTTRHSLEYPYVLHSLQCTKRLRC